MARRKSRQKVSHGLVAMSSAAVLAVYGAGYVRTRPAADRLAQQALARGGNRDLPPPVPAREVALQRPDPAPVASALSTPEPEAPKPIVETSGKAALEKAHTIPSVNTLTKVE